MMFGELIAPTKSILPVVRIPTTRLTRVLNDRVVIPTLLLSYEFGVSLFAILDDLLLGSHFDPPSRFFLNSSTHARTSSLTERSFVAVIGFSPANPSPSQRLHGT